MPPSPFSQVTLKVGQTSYRKLTAIQAQMATSRGRLVTYAEVIEELIRLWESTRAPAGDVQEAGR